MSNKLDHCPICSKKLRKSANFKNVTFSLKCDICGSYSIDKPLIEADGFAEEIKNYKRVISGIIRHSNLIQRKEPHVTTKNLEEYIVNPIIPGLQDVERKLELLLTSMKIMAVIPGHTCDISLSMDYPLAFAWDEKELENLLIILEEDGLIEYVPDNNHSSYLRESIPTTFKNRNQNESPMSFSLLIEDSPSFIITRKGWSFAIFTEPNSQGFVAIDFNDTMDDAIKAIEDGITNCGYLPMVIKNKDYPETIMEKALGEIRKSMFVIVDITNLRPSVFYEAGFAHAIGKPVFYVCSDTFRKKLKKHKKELEFYTKHYKIRPYKNLEELKKMITILIEANFPLRENE